jgi:hypothetical protein
VKKLEVLPEEIEAMQKFLKVNRDVLKFYFEEFGMHLAQKEQDRLGTLMNKSDMLVLKSAKLAFQANCFVSEAEKAATVKKEFLPEKKEAEDFRKALSEFKRDLLEFNAGIVRVVEQLKRHKAEESE